MNPIASSAVVVRAAGVARALAGQNTPRHLRRRISETDDLETPGAPASPPATPQGSKPAGGRAGAPGILLVCLLAAAGWGPAANAGDEGQAAPVVRAAETNAPAKPAPRPPRRLEAEELRALLSSALTQRVGSEGAQWEVRLGRSWPPVMVPDEPLRVEIVEPALSRITSSCILRFELRAGRQMIGSWQMPVQARFWRDVLVAQGALQRGMLLKEAALAHDRCDVLTLREPLCDLPANAGAYEIGETVAAGTPLLARAIRLRPVVSRGQIADAVVRDGAMVISLKVEVLEEGVPGQMIRVRNNQSRRELRGRVEDEHTITIPL